MSLDVPELLEIRGSKTNCERAGREGKHRSSTKGSYSSLSDKASRRFLSSVLFLYLRKREGRVD